MGIKTKSKKITGDRNNPQVAVKLAKINEQIMPPFNSNGWAFPSR